MGIVVICSYQPKAGYEEKARALMAGHVPLLRRHGLITDRAVVQGIVAGFGTYTVDGDTVIIKHAASSYPNRAGTTEKRTFKISGNELTSVNPSMPGMTRSCRITVGLIWLARLMASRASAQ